MTIQTGYAIASISTLKALTDSQRIDGYARLVKSDAKGLPAWYTFLAASSAAGDDDAVVTPNDNPSTGRWIKSSGAGGGADFGGAIICTSGCTIGGKAFQFYAPQSSLQLIVQVGFGISITSGIKSIQIHRWNQTPNTGLTGRQFAAEMPHTGGKAIITIDSTYKWISVFAKNSNNSGAFDGVCFVVSGNVITLVGFG
ncbi:MAG: hypothetical protein KME52_24965 [Desmonostoc geniculatum HA4340-LM1]|nr:hypothetical protein [Desmonostoc geniculatum HA4340-LM1]